MIQASGGKKKKKNYKDPRPGMYGQGEYIAGQHRDDTQPDNQPMEIILVLHFIIS